MQSRQLIKPLHVPRPCLHTLGEETRDASKTLPRSIILGAVFNTLLGLIAVVTFCFTAGSASRLDALLAPTSPHAEFPVVGIYLRATRSRGGTTAMISVLLLVLFISGTMVVTTASRQLWSFARDGGVPFSGTLAKVMLNALRNYTGSYSYNTSPPHTLWSPQLLSPRRFSFIFGLFLLVFSCFLPRFIVLLSFVYYCLCSMNFAQSFRPETSTH
jgi:amino acid transporter